MNKMDDNEFLVWLKDHPELWDVVMNVLEHKKMQDVE